MLKIKKIKLINYYFILISILNLIIFVIYNVFLFSQAQSQSRNLPICVAPGRILVFDSNQWLGENYLIISSSTPGVLTKSQAIIENISNNIISIRNLRLFDIKEGGISLGDPFINFNNLRQASRTDYNKFVLNLNTSTNIFSLIWRQVTPTPSTISIFSVNTSGLFQINSGNLSVNKNIFVTNKIHIGTTTEYPHSFLIISTSPSFIIAGNNNLNSNYLRIEAPGSAGNNNVLFRFNEKLGFYYQQNNFPILFLSNNMIGINNNNPVYSLDVSGNIRATGNIRTDGQFCLGQNCISSWPQGGGGNISGSGIVNRLARWTGNNTLGNSSIIEDPNTNLIEALNKDIVARKFCFRTQNNDLACLSSWPDRPKIGVKLDYKTGIDYPIPQSLLNYLSNNSSEPNVAWRDPFIRPGNPQYDQNIGNGNPYISLRDIILNVGTDPYNPLLTKWFPLAYSYRQPFTNLPTTIFIVEGDNLNPWKRYTKTTSSPEGLNPDNNDDVFVYCHYQSQNRAVYVSGSKSFCDEVRNGQRSGYTIISYTYAERNASIRGYVLFDLRLEPARLRNVCTKRDYLDVLTIATWGSYNILNSRYGNFRYPNLENDPCYDPNTGRRVNMHSLLMARFRVMPYPTSDVNSPNYIEPTPIINFLQDQRANFIVVVKEAGIVELRQY